MCGASAVEVGTMNFIDPAVTMKIINDLEEWLYEREESIQSLVANPAFKNW
jgi:dihydroorotate dehydrogenase (NAD+) catalytic subunit